eukprot:Tamp_12682.p1 GENE.Tamp_12682~~Tamp_12682.p1  ORF type:complete len:189 (+),score=13.13 Tamp_12682:612-1178(+)
MAWLLVASVSTLVASEGSVPTFTSSNLPDSVQTDDLDAILCRMFALGHALGAIAAETAAEIDSSDAGKLSGQRGGYIDIGHNNQANANRRATVKKNAKECLEKVITWTNRDGPMKPLGFGLLEDVCVKGSLVALALYIVGYVTFRAVFALSWQVRREQFDILGRQHLHFGASHHDSDHGCIVAPLSAF